MITEKEKKILFEHLFVDYYARIKAFSLKILKSEEDAEDITQDVFVKLWSTPDIWEVGTISDSYLFTIARNHIFNFLKHKTVESQYEQQLLSTADLLPFDVDINDQLYAKEIELIVKLTVDNMPEQRQKVFRMSRNEELSNQEIADQLGLSVRTVDRHIYLALAELKKIILFFTFFC